MAPTGQPFTSGSFGHLTKLVYNSKARSHPHPHPDHRSFSCFPTHTHTQTVHTQTTFNSKNRTRCLVLFLACFSFFSIFLVFSVFFFFFLIYNHSFGCSLFFSALEGTCSATPAGCPTPRGSGPRRSGPARAPKRAAPGRSRRRETPLAVGEAVGVRLLSFWCCW